MLNDFNHKWLCYANVAEAHASQKEMAEKVSLTDGFDQPIRYIAGMDVSNNRFDPERMMFGATVIASYPSLDLIHTSTQANKQKFPYIPGLLGFREVPTLIDTFKQLSVIPDVILVDGHGISHPRGLGVASHLGVVLDIPTIGVAKSILVGTPAGTLGEEAGSTIPLIWKGNEIGMMLRTKKRCAPLIISPGHKISLKSALEIVMNCVKKYRLPELTRYAHLAANVCRRDYQSRAN
jgi:deoxyribonuclease V